VRYYGNDKPSVDTPIQLCLYGHYAMVNYIIHSHVYVKDAPFTGEKIPCGALEEVDHILSVWPQRDIYNFAINLKGHGSIVFSRDLWYFDKVNYIARPVPEGE
jgi:hypothetical protein